MTGFDAARQNMGDSDAEKAALLIALAIREGLAQIAEEMECITESLDTLARIAQDKEEIPQ